MSLKILVAQGGGPTAVINQSLAGVALQARRFPEFTHVYGARHGVRGALSPRGFTARRRSAQDRCACPSISSSLV